jgi:hypothetical protein
MRDRALFESLDMAFMIQRSKLCIMDNIVTLYRSRVSLSSKELIYDGIYIAPNGYFFSSNLSLEASQLFFSNDMFVRINLDLRSNNFFNLEDFMKNSRTFKTLEKDSVMKVCNIFNSEMHTKKFVELYMKYMFDGEMTKVSRVISDSVLESKRKRYYPYNYSFELTKSEIATMSVIPREIYTNMIINSYMPSNDEFWIYDYIDCLNYLIIFPMGYNIYDKTFRRFMNSSFKVRQTIEKILKLYEFDRVETNMKLNETCIKVFEKNLKELEKDSTLPRFKVYIKSRHDLFGYYVYKFLMTNTKYRRFVEKMDTMDVRIRTVIKNYSGMYSSKTPDFAFVDNMNRKITILDIAVTEGSAIDRHNDKLMSYEMMLAEIKNMKEYSNYRMEVQTAIMDITNSRVFICESNEISKELKNSRMYNKIVNEMMSYHERAKSINNYNLLKDLNSREVSESVSNELDGYYKVLVDYMIAPSTMSSIRTKKSSEMFNMNKTYNPSLETFNTASQDDNISIISKMVSNINTDKVYEDLATLCTERMSNTKYTTEIEKLKNQDLKLIRDKIESIILEEEKLYMQRKDRGEIKIPKLIKYTTYENSMYKRMDNYVMFLNIIKRLDDGTYLLDNKWVYESETVEDFVSTDGLHLDRKMCSEYMSNMIEFLVSESSNEGKDIMDKMTNTKNEYYNKIMKKLRIFEEMEKINNIIKNLGLLVNRRAWPGNKNKNNRVSVYKRFNNYSLLINAGSRMTSQKSIRFKVMVDVKPMVPEYFCHKYMYDEMWECYTTKWLSLSMSDFDHFEKIFRTGVCIGSLYCDSHLENKDFKNINRDIFSKEIFIMPLIYLMEHKRDTSTTSQLNRYLLHTGTAFASDKEGLAESIMKKPVRSVVSMYTRMRQLDWFKALLKDTNKILSNNMDNFLSTSTSYDKFNSPSIFSTFGDNDEEFCTLINDIYNTNLFNPKSGFKAHRTKPIWEKIAVLEEKFRDKVNMNDYRIFGITNSMEEFLEGKDDKHIFDMEVVYTAAVRVRNKLNNTKSFHKAILKSVTALVDDAMKMTRLLDEVGFETVTLSGETSATRNEWCLKALALLVRNYGTNYLVGMINRMSVVESILNTFAKDQLGDVREILVQNKYLRCLMKFLENMTKEICKIHEKEMLTGDKVKKILQSKTLSKYRSSMTIMESKMVNSLMLSLNSDATKWSPGFVVWHFIVFILGLDLPKKITSTFISALKAFGDKALLISPSLINKWKRFEGKEDLEKDVLEWVRSQVDLEFGILNVKSGTGQGMWHFFSSLYHSACDDLADDILGEVLKPLKAKCFITTMLSSDDKTKIYKVDLAHVNNMGTVVLQMMEVVNLVGRLMNIHINWKKTAMHNFITEFNSFFSIGKRVVMPVIKDVYTGLSCVDLTYPEIAVKSVIDQISRAFKNGVYLTTCQLMFDLMRTWLMDCYRIDEHMVNLLMAELECKEEDLPYQIGFLPNRNILVTMIYGPEYTMFMENIRENKKMMMFYHGVYSVPENFDEEDVKKMETLAMMGIRHYKVMCNMKLDKQMLNFKKEMNEIFGNNDEIMTKLNSNFMVDNMPSHSYTKYLMNTYKKVNSIESTYPMGEKVMHTLIRALAPSNLAMRIKPLTKNAMEEIMVKFPDYLDSSSKRVAEMTNDMIFSHDLLSFTKTMKTISKSQKSYLSLFNIYKKMDVLINKMDKISKEKVMVKKREHNKMNKLKLSLIESIHKLDYNSMLNKLMDSDEFITTMEEKYMNLFLSNFNLDCKKFRSDIMSSMKKIMPNSKRIFLDLMCLVRSYCTSTMRKDMDVVCTFKNKGNYMDNMLMLFCERFSPRYNLKSPFESSVTKNEKILLNIITLSKDINSIMKFLKDKDLYMSKDTDNLMRNFYNLFKITEMSDRKNMILRKGRTRTVDEEKELNMINENLDEFVLKKFLYKEIKETLMKKQVYYDTKTLMVAEIEDLAKRVNIFIYTKDKAYLNSGKIMSNFHFDMEKFKESGYKMNFITNEEEYNYYGNSYYYNLSNVNYTLSVDYKPRKWTAKINVKMLNYDFSWDIFRDNYSLFYKLLSREDVKNKHIREIQDFMAKKKTSMRDVYNYMEKTGFTSMKKEASKIRNVSIMTEKEKRIKMEEEEKKEEEEFLRILQEMEEMDKEKTEDASLDFLSRIGLKCDVVSSTTVRSKKFVSSLEEWDDSDLYKKGLIDMSDKVESQFTIDTYKNYFEKVNSVSTDESKEDIFTMVDITQSDRVSLKEMLMNKLDSAFNEEYRFNFHTINKIIEHKPEFFYTLLYDNMRVLMTRNMSMSRIPSDFMEYVMEVVINKLSSKNLRPVDMKFKNLVVTTNLMEDDWMIQNRKVDTTIEKFINSINMV